MLLPLVVVAVVVVLVVVVVLLVASRSALSQCFTTASTSGVGSNPYAVAVGELELRQVYMASEHHVIVEGLRAGPGGRGLCVIYTIEQGAITRQFVYD